MKTIILFVLIVTLWVLLDRLDDLQDENKRLQVECQQTTSF